MKDLENGDTDDLVKYLWTEAKKGPDNITDVKVNSISVLAKKENVTYDEVDLYEADGQTPIDLYDIDNKTYYTKLSDNQLYRIKVVDFTEQMVYIVQQTNGRSWPFSLVHFTSSDAKEHAAKYSANTYNKMTFYFNTEPAEIYKNSCSKPPSENDRLDFYHAGNAVTTPTYCDNKYSIKTISVNPYSEDGAYDIYKNTLSLSDLYYMTSNTSETNAKVNGVDYYKTTFYKQTGGEVIPYSVNVSSSAATYLSQRSLSRRGANSGVELKLAYFHDLNSNFMCGIDLSGNIGTKSRKDVNIGQFNVNPVNSDLVLRGDFNRLISNAKYNGGNYSTTVEGSSYIKQGETLTLSNNESFKSAIQTANPSVQVSTDHPGIDYVDTSDGSKDLSFEKGLFTPKLAFVVGGTLGGWFAGVRTGVSYMTGKVKTHDMTNYKNVSISSPFVGVHVMKQLNDNVHMYMTADWNVGDGRKSVDMNGIRSFKQSSYNVSAGVTWRIKTGK